jgi:hypothetical protein
MGMGKRPVWLSKDEAGTLLSTLLPVLWDREDSDSGQEELKVLIARLAIIAQDLHDDGTRKVVK